VLRLVFVVLVGVGSLSVSWAQSLSEAVARVKDDPGVIFAFAATGSPDQLRALLAAGASLEVRDEFGQTPLMYAADKNSRESVRVLVEADRARANDVSAAGWTPLMYAARRPEVEAFGVTLALLVEGADPGIRASDGVDARSLAESHGSEAALAALSLGARADAEALPFLEEQVALSGDAYLAAQLSSALQHVGGRDQEAKEWAEYALNNGEARGAMYLARIFELGAGVPVDLDRALSLYRLAADAGVRGAATGLAALYLTSDDPSKQASALALLEPWAERGDPDARFLIASSHLLGFGVPRDSRRALVMLDALAKEEFQPAIDTLEALKDTISLGKTEEQSPQVEALLAQEPLASQVAGPIVWKLADALGGAVPCGSAFQRAYAVACSLTPPTGQALTDAITLHILEVDPEENLFGRTLSWTASVDSDRLEIAGPGGWFVVTAEDGWLMASFEPGNEPMVPVPDSAPAERPSAPGATLADDTSESEALPSAAITQREFEGGLLGSGVSRAAARAGARFAPFALQPVGSQSNMPPLSARNLFVYESLVPMDAMNLDCSSVAVGLQQVDEVFCAGYIGTFRQFVDEWRAAPGYGVLLAIDWMTQDSAAQAMFVVENGVLIGQAINLPDVDASIILFTWNGCRGELGSTADITRWSKKHKDNLAECMAGL